VGVLNLETGRVRKWRNNGQREWRGRSTPLFLFRRDLDLSLLILFLSSLNSKLLFNYLLP